MKINYDMFYNTGKRISFKIHALIEHAKNLKTVSTKAVVFIPAFRSSFLPYFEEVFIINHLVFSHNGGSVVLVQQKPQSLVKTTVNH